MVTGNRQGFAMWNLQDCDVYILDHTAQVQVDDCINCNIVIGRLSKSSVTPINYG
jgi:protein XRP2